MAKRRSSVSHKTVRTLFLGLALSVSILFLLVLVFLKQKASFFLLSQKVIQTVDGQLADSGLDMEHPLILIRQVNTAGDRPYNYCTRRQLITNEYPSLGNDLTNCLEKIQATPKPKIISTRTSVQDDGTLTVYRIGTGRIVFYLLEFFRPSSTETKGRFVFPFPPQKPHGRIAIIIDDVGATAGETVQKFLSFPEKMTFAIMPSLANTGKTADMIHAVDRFQIMLHQPMQPLHEGKFLPPGEILTNMSDTEIDRALDANFSSVKYAIGMNNHEGSLATSNPRIMTAVLKYMRAHGLFYIDSYTSKNSVGFKIAKKMKVLYNKRDVFLDNEENEAYIQKQLDLLVRTALKEGSVIGIGHITKPMTIKVLLENVESMKNQGIEFVLASEVLKR